MTTTATTTLPRHGTAVACKECGNPTRDRGADMYECKSKDCRALTIVTTNPGNPSRWPA